MDHIECQRCAAHKPAIERPPFKGERGATIQSSICRDCWSDWLTHQTLLINHYGLDPRDAKSREFLYAQIDKVLLGNEDADDIDTSVQGTIEW